ncbi:6-hydroxymethylpterin diphosphokinase MptE-like protein [Spirochaeta thermophila]|uniref:6-hydroxymethylpterin diphosphokinase MptE-like domain-containing protein n=1 Tax=Winmispira thermophila (strain ATCC 49972 / DSM 6192 / RI 19.B1) TaxID=665571 RepID=E0RSV7_WINT6|nr:6-hydroxymethylpterin diphosphokinase MptE-like protein [Spirochaeta thermophila]ADN02094.1 hypothetical protein STHERM_c11510 [Spirochaeta thermophila DSM 6192]
MRNAGERDLEIVPTDEGESLRYRGVSLYHPEAPKSRAGEKARRVPLSPHTLYVIISPLFWYGVEELVSRLPPTSTLVALEADPLLRSLAASRRPPSLSHIPLLAPDDPLPPARFRAIQPVHLSSGYRLAPRTYTEWLEHHRRELHRAWQNRLTLIRLGPRYLRNLILNLPSLPHTVPYPRPSRPVLVAAAGPSLPLALPAIRRHRTSLFLLAADTAAPTLLSAGITPDAVLLLDPQAFNALDLAGIPPGIPLFFDLVAHPSAIRHFHGPRHPLCSRFLPSRLFDLLSEHLPRLPLVPPMGSVGTLAALLALLLSDGPVILAGLDLSFPPGLTHSPGTLHHTLQLAARTRTTPWPSLTYPPGHRPLPSHPRLHTTPPLRTFARQLEDLAHIHPRIHTLTPIPPCPHIPLIDSETIPSLAASPAAPPYTPPEPWTVATLLTRLEEELEHTLSTLSSGTPTLPDYLEPLLPGIQPDPTHPGTRAAAHAILAELLRSTKIARTILERPT